MCGIFAYLNYFTPQQLIYILKTLLEGLKSLEYRGYDSAGIAFDNDTPCQIITIIKEVGKITLIENQVKEHEKTVDVSKLFSTHVGLAHTRWATHGEPSKINAHPHGSDINSEFVVVHNGIITNFKDLEAFLVKHGYQLISETDTEVIAKLIKHLFDNHKNDKLTFIELVELTIKQLEGAFALAFKSIHFPGEIVVTRRGSPMMVGIKSSSRVTTDRFPVTEFKTCRGVETIGQPQHLNSEVLRIEPVDLNKGVEYFFSSDLSAIAQHTSQVIYLEDDDVAAVVEGQLILHQSQAVKHNEASSREIITIQQEIQQIRKGSFSSFMKKEIYEQVSSVMNTMRGRVNFETNQVILGGIKTHVSEIRRCRRLLIIASGTSYHSGIATRQLIEELSELPVMVDQASDFVDRNTPIFRDDVCIFVSQSGETADTLEALRYCRKHGALIIGITNSVGSSVCRESHCGVHINAGPEIGIASTKTYTSEIIALVMFALVMCEDRISLIERRAEIIAGLKKLPHDIARILATDNEIKKLATELYGQKSLLVMGRGFNYATCLEGALKIKELVYMHSEGLLAGELKHGPLALVDDLMPLIIIITRDHVYPKCMNALQQVIARNGKPILICNEGDEDTKNMAYKWIEVPRQVDCLQNILTIVPMQLLSLHISELLGYDVDQPRNLLKTYTERD